MTSIVFSKDRAMQLHAFLRSYHQHVTPWGQVRALFLATTDRHARAYADVFSQFTPVPIPQGESFKKTLLSLLPRTGNVAFFVDDQIFIRPWEVLEEPGLSLRLGTHLTREYAFNDALMPLPPFETLKDGRIRWRWADGQLSWAYPMSLDGYVFDANEIAEMIEPLYFHSPNTLEMALQRYVGPEYGTCYYESKVVNVPWNLVQSDWNNRHVTDGPSAEALLHEWERGRQLHLNHIEGVLNQSVHQEFPLVLEPRC